MPSNRHHPSYLAKFSALGTPGVPSLASETWQFGDGNPGRQFGQFGDSIPIPRLFCRPFPASFLLLGAHVSILRQGRCRPARRATICLSRRLRYRRELDPPTSSVGVSHPTLVIPLAAPMLRRSLGGSAVMDLHSFVLIEDRRVHPPSPTMAHWPAKRAVKAWNAYSSQLYPSPQFFAVSYTHSPCNLRPISTFSPSIHHARTTLHPAQATHTPSIHHTIAIAAPCFLHRFHPQTSLPRW